MSRRFSSQTMLVSKAGNNNRARCCYLMATPLQDTPPFCPIAHTSRSNTDAGIGGIPPYHHHHSGAGNRGFIATAAVSVRDAGYCEGSSSGVKLTPGVHAGNGADPFCVFVPAASLQRDFGVQSPRPHRGSSIMESAYAWLVWIALGFGVAAIIAQWIRLLRKPAVCLRCGGRLKKVDGTWVCEKCV